ncbi:hypothetical protein RJ640_004837 [Escallonia rubra]|uniref:HMA domain-containing protein n=1 Tax=Escallonia rubra TaxID=112253 RepID=A0AA88QSH1_9ASTE|nr:hypothetical protein RJ640_004837 [Escallonia rubra]
MKMMEVLSSINGVYSVSIDSRSGTAKVSGEVDPNILLRALATAGNHAELVRVKLKHSGLNRGYHGSYGFGSYGTVDHSLYAYGTGYAAGLYGHPWYDIHQPYHHRRRSVVDYPWCSTMYRQGYGSYGHGHGFRHGYGF